MRPPGTARRVPPLQGAFAFLVGAKLLLAGLLVAGAVYPHGPFEGKGMLYRLPAFLAPGLIVTWRWWQRTASGDVAPYPVALDIGLTLPFLSDTLGNAFGWFDSVQHFDSVMHTVNWAFLCGGVTLTIGRSPAGAPVGRTLLVVIGAGIGAMAIVGWEIMEYGVMKSGVEGLHLTYADTLGDLGLSTVGGFLGAWWAARRLDPRVPSAVLRG